MLSTKKIASILSVLALSFSAAVADATPRYTVTDLGTLGGPYSYANALNDSGQVVGSASPPVGDRLAYISVKGIISDITPLGMTRGEALSINTVGDAVGYSYVTPSSPLAFVYSQGKSRLLTELGSGLSEAKGINDLGQITGVYTNSQGYERAFIDQNGIVTDLGTLGATASTAAAINNHGEVTGESARQFDSVSHAFYYTHGTMIDIGTMIDTNTMNTAQYCSGVAINDNGEIAGNLLWLNADYTDFYNHAFVYSHGVMTDLGALFNQRCYASGIGEAGQVVGYTVNNQNQNAVAFLYANGQMQNLTDLIDPNSGWQLNTAAAINRQGQIVGEGSHNGQIHGYLLTPIPPPSALTALTATGVSNSEISLHWNAAANAARYNVFRGPISGQYHTYIGSTTTNGFIDRNLSAGTTYYYIVTPTNAIGDGPKSAEVAATTFAMAPSTAPHVSAIPVTQNQITLIWSAVPSATSYLVFRGTAPGQLHSYVATTTTPYYNDMQRTPATAYYYIVIAVNAYGQGPKSAEVGAITFTWIPNYAPAVSATPVARNQINLTWSAVPTATSYLVFRSLTPGGYHSYVATITTPSYIDTQRTPSTSYYYIVIAANAYGQGPKSAEVAATTPAN